MIQSISKKTAETINLMEIPDTIESQRINVFWVRIVDSSYEIFSAPHRHTFCEVHVCLSGSVSYRVGDEIFCLSQGKGIAFAPQTEHCYLENRSADFAKCVLAFSADEDSEFYSSLLSLKPALFSVDSDFEAALADIVSSAEIGNCFAAKISALAAFKMIYSVLKSNSFPFPKAEAPNNEDPRLAVAKKYIKSNYKRMLTCEEVAQECGLSVKQLGRIFKKHTDLSLAEYIKECKLRACEEMLLDGRFTVKQVGYELGFENEYYFNSFFKRKYGMPPGAFRKQKLITSGDQDNE